MSDAAPHFQSVADDLCVINSMYTDQFNHTPAELLLFTGSPRGGRPSFGSWVTYGLGSENANLPGFVVLISSGVLPGEITREAAGADGFGYDPVFRPLSDPRTLAEMTRDEKAAISHRGRAARGMSRLRGKRPSRGPRRTGAVAGAAWDPGVRRCG